MGDTLKYLVSVLNNEGPFDGFLAFSQGSYIVRAFLQVLQSSGFDEPLKHDPPRFVMFYSSTWYLKRRYFYYRGKRFMMNEGLLRTPMIHIYGKNDHFLKVLRTHELFENAVCVVHEEGRPQVYKPRCGKANANQDKYSEDMTTFVAARNIVNG